MSVDPALQKKVENSVNIMINTINSEILTSDNLQKLIIPLSKKKLKSLPNTLMLQFKPIFIKELIQYGKEFDDVKEIIKREFLLKIVPMIKKAIDKVISRLPITIRYQAQMAAKALPISNTLSIAIEPVINAILNNVKAQITSFGRRTRYY